MKANKANVHQDKKDIYDQMVFYQNRCIKAENTSMNLQKAINKLSGYLSNIGLSIDSLKEAGNTGVLKFDKFNTEKFKFEGIGHRHKPQKTVKLNMLKRISEESDLSN